MNRCPSCRKLILGCEVVKNKNRGDGEAKYRRFCPHCRIEIVFEIKKKVPPIFFAVVITIIFGISFKWVKYVFLELVVFNGKIQFGMLGLEILVMAALFAGYLRAAMFIAHRYVKVTAIKDDSNMKNIEQTQGG